MLGKWDMRTDEGTAAGSRRLTPCQCSALWCDGAETHAKGDCPLPLLLVWQPGAHRGAPSNPSGCGESGVCPALGRIRPLVWPVLVLLQPGVRFAPSSTYLLC